MTSVGLSFEFAVCTRDSSSLQMRREKTSDAIDPFVADRRCRAHGHAQRRLRGSPSLKEKSKKMFTGRSARDRVGTIVVRPLGCGPGAGSLSVLLHSPNRPVMWPFLFSCRIYILVLDARKKIKKRNEKSHRLTRFLLGKGEKKETQKDGASGMARRWPGRSTLRATHQGGPVVECRCVRRGRPSRPKSGRAGAAAVPSRNRQESSSNKRE